MAGKEGKVDVTDLMQSAALSVVRISPVSRKVNSVRNDAADLLKEVADLGLELSGDGGRSEPGVVQIRTSELTSALPQFLKFRKLARHPGSGHRCL